MTMTVLCSATGAPGVTTTALALAWVWPWVRPDRRVLVVDADAAGSGILPGYLHVGTAPGGGVLALAAERTALSAETVFEHSIALDPGDQRVLLTGVTDPGQARTARAVWTGLGEVAAELDSVGVDVVVDVGRLGHRYEPSALLEHAQVVALVLRSTLPSVAGAAGALRRLREMRGPGSSTTAVLIGDGQPYTAREIARELSVEPLHLVATDRWAAEALSPGTPSGWRFERSPLLRSARGLVGSLTAEIDALTPAARP